MLKVTILALSASFIFVEYRYSTYAVRSNGTFWLRKMRWLV
jgi:hypothetical protein